MSAKPNHSGIFAEVIRKTALLVLANQYLVVSFVFCAVWGASITHLPAQPGLLSDVVATRQLARAEAHLRAFRNDSAIVVSGSLLKALKAAGRLHSPLGIQVRLVEASALERDEQNDQALQKLLRVEQESRPNELAETHARVCLAIALLYEKIGRQDNSRHHLERAKADIDRYGLATVYPYYAIRRSSWERLFGTEEAALHYAYDALNTAQRHRLLLEEAISRMLLNMLLPKSAVDERMHHSRLAARLYQQLGDHTGRSYMLSAVASLYFQQNDFRWAMVYNDSTIAAASRAIAEGHEQHAAIAGYYRFRGRIYKQLGQLDSALANIERGYRMELALREKDANEKVIEIDARYQSKYRQTQLEEQQLALRLKNNQLVFSAIILFLVLLLACGLYIGYHKQRRAKQLLIEQNTTIQHQAHRLESLDAAKTRFFANISHELRTPLSLIVGPVNSLLKDNQLSDKQTLLLKSVSHSARQLELMVKDILDLRKLEVGKMPLNEEPTALKSFFELHLSQFESLAHWKKIQYAYTIQIDPERVADLDREKCRQVLYNLLSNAFKFTPVAGSVDVAVAIQHGQLSLRVADTGPGIHPDDLPQVFDRFFQTSQKKRSLAGGTGIGLSICHEYTKLLNGDVRAESTLGEGSVFSASWPIRVLDTENPTVSPLPVPERVDLEWAPMSVTQFPSKNGGSEASAASRPTILVVEDNAGLRSYIQLLLADSYRVITAENGKEALQQIASAKPSIDLVLSDLMMPVMDGYTLLENLKSGDATRHIPVVMLTARAEPGDRLQALRIGVDDYLTKPFDEEELLVRIANLLRNQTVRRQEALIESLETTTRPTLSATDQKWLETFEAYIQANLASDILTIPALSETFAMSESTLLRQLKRLTGLTPVQYLQEVRLNRARLLLETDPRLPISIVASQVGYQDARSFARSFKNRFGRVPSAMLEA